MNIDRSTQDKLIALIVAALSIGAYLFLAYSRGPDEFLKNIALLFAGVLAGLLRGDSSINASPETGDTIINKTVTEEAK
jgi:hypothetical protein